MSGCSCPCAAPGGRAPCGDVPASCPDSSSCGVGNSCPIGASTCPCASRSGPAPCRQANGNGASGFRNELLWETCALAANGSQVSRAVATGGGNAAELIVVAIAGLSSPLQLTFSLQSSSDGTNWSTVGSLNVSNIGYTASSAFTGIGDRLLRVIASDGNGNAGIFGAILRMWLS